MYFYSRVYSITSEKNLELAIMVRGKIITVKTVKLYKMFKQLYRWLRGMLW